MEEIYIYNKDMNISTYRFLSFDFTNVPITKTMEIIKKKLEQDDTP